MDKEFKILIPESWSEVSVEKYIKISELDSSDQLDYLMNVICILSDVSKDIIIKISYAELQNMGNLLSWMVNMPNTTILQDKYKIDKDTYYHINPESLTIGEIVSYEILVDDNNLNNITCLPYILAILLRKKKDNKLELFDASKMLENAELFNKMSIDQVSGLLFFFQKWRKDLYRNFRGLFKGNKEEPLEDEEDKPEIRESFSRWKWFSIVEKLALGDITKFDEVYKQNYIACLNLLSYWKEKDDIRKQMAKDAKGNK